MFFVDETTSTSSFTPSQGGEGFMKDVTTAMKDAVNPANFIKGLKEIEGAATTTARTIFGQLGRSSDLIQETIVESFKNTVKIGAKLEDNVNIYKAISTSLQRNAYLTNEQLESLVAIQRTTNLTAEEIGVMVTGFQDLGRGTDAAIESIEGLTKTARGYGLNVNTFLKKVGENIKLVNSYGFQDGVEGLGRMVARAQSLRMNFDKVTSLAGELLNPEKAIEVAASFQTLGGEIGALGDPFKLMYMAENDMEGLQNAIIDTAKSAVMFNEETGEFKLSGVEMRRLRAQADALGMTYEDLANTAVKAAKEQRVMEALDFTGLNEQQKQLVANLGEIGKNGEIKLKLPGFEGSIEDFTNLTEAQQKKLYDAIEKQNETQQLTEKEIAAKSLSIQDQQLVVLRDIKSAGLLAGGYLSAEEGSKGEDLESLMRSVAKATGEQTSDTIEQFVTTSEFTKSVTSFVTGSESFLTDLGQSVRSFTTSVNQLTSSLPGAMSTQLNLDDPVNQFKDSLQNLTVSMESAVEFFNNIPSGGGGNGQTENMEDDFVSFPGGQRMLSVGADTFKINDLDTIIGGTFPDKNMVSNESKNISFSPLEVKINVSGVNNQQFADLMNSNEFRAAVRKQVLAGIGSPLGNTTAGFVG